MVLQAALRYPPCNELHLNGRRQTYAAEPPAPRRGARRYPVGLTFIRDRDREVSGSRRYRKGVFFSSVLACNRQLSDFYGAIDASGKRRLQPFLDEGMDRIIHLFESEYLNNRLEASVDSIIFEDGTLAGPDTAGKMDSINSRIRADSDLLDALAGLRGDEFRKALLLHSGSALASPDEYSQHKMGTAQNIIDSLDRDGEAVTLEKLEDLRRGRWFGKAGVVRRRER